MGAGRHDVVAGALVRDGRVLLGHRHPLRRWYPDVWDLPGGHVEAGESAPDALRRELHEEVGVVADVTGPPLWSVLDEDMGLRVWLVTGWRGVPRLMDPTEHDDLGWFTLAEALALDLADPRYEGLLTLLLGS